MRSSQSAPATVSFGAAASSDLVESEPLPASPRAIVARRALLAAALLGVLADPLLRHEPWGLGLVAWMAAFAGVVTIVARQAGKSLSGESGTWLVVAVLFAAGLSWRDAELLHVFNVFAMLAALVLLATSSSGIPVTRLGVARVRDLMRAATGTGLSVATGFVLMTLRDAELHAALRPSSQGRLRRIIRAVVIAAPVVVVFTLLLAQADPVFGSFFRFPDVEIDVLLSHVFIAGFFTWVVAGWLRRALLVQDGARHGVATPFPLTLGPTDVAIGLGALNVLFAFFVVVQIGWLFGGESLVLRTTGLTYAEYARRGFFEVSFVAGLLLPVLLGAQAVISAPDARTHRLFRQLSLVLVLLLGAVMLSAGARMRLYMQYYGISTDRLYATAFMIWLAIVFVWFALTVLRSRPRTFAAGSVISGFAVLFTLNVLNPDALVARSNLARADGGRAGGSGPDWTYLASLGGDAVPLLVSGLGEAGAVADTAVQRARCEAAVSLLNRWTGERGERRSRHWMQWNQARARAAATVRAQEAALRQSACPG